MSQVLFATDLSDPASVAERLIQSIPWPSDTSIRVVTVVPPLRELTGAPWMAVAPLNTDELETAQLHRAETRVREVVGRLRATGLDASWLVMRGAPADAIAAVATRERTDLIVMGSRGLNALEGALLGSVSEGVVDRAPCPVLIARTDWIRQSLFAEDASDGANLALDFVCAHQHLLGRETRVVGVVNPYPIWPETFDMPIDAHSVQVIADDEAELRVRTRTASDEAAAALREAGQPAVAECCEGAPAGTLVDVALATRTDLVVVGNRRRTGVTRLLLGSVSRHVLHHAHCSVLLVGNVASRPMRESAPVAAATVH
jgi:nucleotide-binding universal stress UspA family protein